MMEAVLQALTACPFDGQWLWPCPQASGRNGRLRLCGVVWAMGLLEAAIQYTALLVFVWFVCFCGDAFHIS